MKIIKKGKLWWIGKQIHCNTCETVFQLDEDDRIVRKMVRDFSDDTTVNNFSYEYWTECPTCRDDIRFIQDVPTGTIAMG